MASLPEAAAEEQRTASAAGKTDVGRRRDHNEDQILVSPELSLYAVADGMGGHQAGDVASSITAAALEEYFWEAQDVGDDIDGLDGLPPGAVRLVKAIHHCNREVFSRSGRSANQGGMGSTVVALHVDEEEEVLHIAHVGDSRCYRIRNGAIELITQDHSMINEALRLNPDLSEEILRQLPSNVVTRALGTKENVQPDVCTQPLVKGDLYLLCSDGLSGEVADEDLLFGVLESENLEDGCELLVAMANEAGGRDNISAVLLRVEKGLAVPPAVDQPRLVLDRRRPKAESVADEDDQDDVDVNVQEDDHLDDADLDAWLAEPSDPGEELEAAETDVVFSEPPPPRRVEDDEEDDYLEDDLLDGDDRELDDDGELEDEGQLVEPEGLSALAPPFGNEPPRLRRPSSVPPEATPEEPDPEDQIAALPVMGIGDLVEEPPTSTPELRRRCHHCGHRLLPEERYCGMCGTRTHDDEKDPSLPVCDACGSEIVDDTRFCVECGVRL